MTRPSLPQTVSYSFSEMLADFGNINRPPHRLSDYYGAESSSWVDPDQVALTPTDVSSSFVAFDGVLVTDNAADTSANYSVAEIQVTRATAGRIYIAHKTTSNPTYYSDAPVACVQIIGSNGTTLYKTYYFANGDPDGWQTTTTALSGGSNAGISTTPSGAAARTYSTMANGTYVNRFNLASATSSNNTGAAGGIVQPTTAMTAGTAVIAQDAIKYYAYNETSGAALYSQTFMRSPSYASWSSGMIVRIAYIIGNRSATTDTSRQNPTDTLHLGIY